jgi:hypothetical protein
MLTGLTTGSGLKKQNKVLGFSMTISKLWAITISFLPWSQSLISRCGEVERHGTINRGPNRMLLKYRHKLEPLHSMRVTIEHDAHDSLEYILHINSDPKYKYSLRLRSSRELRSDQGVISRLKALRGGNSEAVTPLQSSSRVSSLHGGKFHDNKSAYFLICPDHSHFNNVLVLHDGCLPLKSAGGLA